MDSTLSAFGEQNQNMISRQKVERIATLDGVTLCFMIYLGSRSRGWKTFSPEDVPAFEGKSAVFEVEVFKGVWTFVRQIPD